MSYIDYLSKNLINKVKDSEEITFVSNVAHEITKFGLAFIYNHYRPIISIRIGDYMKGLY